MMGVGINTRKYFQKLYSWQSRWGNSFNAFLTHYTNRGKGRELKTDFQYVIDNDDRIKAVITADSGGQHTVECIKKIIGGIRNETSAFIYLLQAFIQMGCSAGIITIFVKMIPTDPELLFKIVIDTILFLISYYIQQKIVF